jgi:hypothetical protein
MQRQLRINIYNSQTMIILSYMAQSNNRPTFKRTNSFPAVVQYTFPATRTVYEVVIYIACISYIYLFLSGINNSWWLAVFDGTGAAASSLNRLDNSLRLLIDNFAKDDMLAV